MCLSKNLSHSLLLNIEIPLGIISRKFESEKEIVIRYKIDEFLHRVAVGV